MIAIKHRFTNATLCEFEVETLKYAVELGKANLRGSDLRGADLRVANLLGADLRGADMRGSDLREANLYEANLRVANLLGADLRGADMRGSDLLGSYLIGSDLREATIDYEKITKNPINIPCGIRYVALITDNYMRLGCKRYTHAEWAAFSDEEIAKMDCDALEFWKQWKVPLLAMCDAHRCE